MAPGKKHHCKIEVGVAVHLHDKYITRKELLIYDNEDFSHESEYSEEGRGGRLEIEY